MVTPFFFSIFEGLPRQGPGDDRCTAEACKYVLPLPDKPEILDIGCGSGMQTIALAKLCTGCRITATDIYQPFLDDINEKAKREELSEKIKTVCASMDDLPFENESFDLLWAEGSIFIIGIEKAVNLWRDLLKSGGKLVFTEAVWFTDSPSEEAKKFWTECYPDIKEEEEVRRILESSGYRMIKTFRLPDSAWTDDYYIPLEDKIIRLKEGNLKSEEEEILNSLLEEIRIFRNYSPEYGYTFFIAEKRE